MKWNSPLQFYRKSNVGQISSLPPLHFSLCPPPPAYFFPSSVTVFYPFREGHFTTSLGYCKIESI